jgi:hypothetical protein
VLKGSKLDCVMKDRGSAIKSLSAVHLYAKKIETLTRVRYQVGSNPLVMNVLIGYLSVRAGALSLYYSSDGPALFVIQKCRDERWNKTGPSRSRIEDLIDSFFRHSKLQRRPLIPPIHLL